MKTFNGASTPYATPADFMARVDVNMPGLLVRDDDSQASPTELLTDGNLAAALQDGSGVLESALLVSERYTILDLQVIPDNSNAGGLIKRIVVGLAVQFLRERRGIMEQTTLPIYEQAVALIEALHQGKNIFAFVETEVSGLPGLIQLQPADFFSGTPNLVTNVTRYFGYRLNRRGFPGGSGGDWGNGWDRGGGGWGG